MQMTQVNKIKEQFQEEWLLFEVLESDELEVPKQVRLIMHSKDRDAIHSKLQEINCPYAYIIYAGEPIPKGTAVVL